MPPRPPPRLLLCRPSQTTHLAPRPSRPHLRRPFFDLPLPPPPAQTLSASRTLPYHQSRLFDLIADIDSYSAFVPFCHASRVTRWSSPSADADPGTATAATAADNRRLPVQADLRVGWGGFDETFTSAVRCVPDRLVEARSGRHESGDAAGAGARASSAASQASGAVFSSLVTRWTLAPSRASTPASPRSDVHLDITFQFANPLYAAVSAAVSDKVAGTMIAAFEERAHRLLGRAEGHRQAGAPVQQGRQLP